MAQDMFLKLTGIKGESEDKAHKEEIDVLAYSFGMSQSATMHVGGGGGGGKVAMQDVSLTKYTDKSTPELLKFCCSGKHIAEGRLIVRKAGGNPIEYFTITMKEIIISSYSTGSAGSEDRQTENVSLNFKEISFQYIEQKKDGGEGAKPDYAWNIAENTEMSAFKMG